MVSFLHTTSGNNPSHRWFFLVQSELPDALVGEWRCACGKVGDGLNDPSMPCSVHSAIGPMFGHGAHAQREDRVEVEWVLLKGAAVSETLRTEKQRCEWAGLPYAEPDYQHVTREEELDGYLLPSAYWYLFEHLREITEQMSNLEFGAGLATNPNEVEFWRTTWLADDLEDLVRDAINSGGIVRRGCELRDATGVRPARLW